VLRYFARIARADTKWNGPFLAVATLRATARHAPCLARGETASPKEHENGPVEPLDILVV
jgi:hypothetical protein